MPEGSIDGTKLHSLLSTHGSVSGADLPRMFRERFGEPISTPAGVKLKDMLGVLEERGICRLENREMPGGPPLLWVHLPSSCALSEGWEQRTDPSTGRDYYVDHNTRTSHWEMPARSRY